MSHSTFADELQAAKEKERNKTASERAEDIAYTINHSLACTATDFLNPVINTLTEGYIKSVGGCGHDHSKDGGHHHAPASSPSHKGYFGRVGESLKTSFSGSRLKRWAMGEFIGDFGAVPLTLGTQHYAPGFMHGLRKFFEPIVAPLFHWGAERETKNWAQKEHIALDSEQAKNHAAELYEHEMAHFPQALAWTGYSLGLNVATQIVHQELHPPKGCSHGPGKKTTPLQFLATAAAGMGVTAGLVVGARAAAPEKMQSFDRFTSKNILLPATKLVGRTFGIDENTVERMQQKQGALHGNAPIERTSWAQKIMQEENPAVTVNTPLQ